MYQMCINDNKVEEFSKTGELMQPWEAYAPPRVSRTSQPK